MKLLRIPDSGCFTGNATIVGIDEVSLRRTDTLRSSLIIDIGLRARVANSLLSIPESRPVTGNTLVVAVEVGSRGWASALFVDCNESSRASYTRFRGFIPPRIGRASFADSLLSIPEIRRGACYTAVVSSK